MQGEDRGIECAWILLFVLFLLFERFFVLAQTYYVLYNGGCLVPPTSPPHSRQGCHTRESTGYSKRLLFSLQLSQCLALYYLFSAPYILGTLSAPRMDIFLQTTSDKEQSNLVDVGDVKVEETKGNGDTNAQRNSLLVAAPVASEDKKRSEATPKNTGVNGRANARVDAHKEGNNGKEKEKQSCCVVS